MEEPRIPVGKTLLKKQKTQDKVLVKFPGELKSRDFRIPGILTSECLVWQMPYPFVDMKTILDDIYDLLKLFKKKWCTLDLVRLTLQETKYKILLTKNYDTAKMYGVHLSKKMTYSSTLTSGIPSL